MRLAGRLGCLRCYGVPQSRYFETLATTGFLSPQIDPDAEGPTLPGSTREEYRPFSRRVPEFKFWYSATIFTLLCARA